MKTPDELEGIYLKAFKDNTFEFEARNDILQRICAPFIAYFKSLECENYVEWDAEIGLETTSEGQRYRFTVEKVGFDTEGPGAKAERLEREVERLRRDLEICGVKDNP